MRWFDRKQQVVDGVSIEDRPSDAPELKRMYMGVFAWGRIEWEIKTFIRSRGTLWIDIYQHNGRHIFADPHELADKLIIPNVLADAERFVEKVKRIDKEFLASDAANLFTDENGDEWQKVHR